MNFLCISNHNNDLSWVKKYPNPYIIYDRSDNDSLVEDLNYIKSPNVGYNIYDICTFIIDNYNQLPEYTTFCKGNVFPRHVTIETFEKLMNNKFFTPIFDYKLHEPYMPICMFSSDGNFSEINNSWYMKEGKPSKYFKNYNDFLNFIFINPFIPNYNTFAPGGNYVVPKNMILKYNIEFYKNLRTFVSHDSFSSESHIIERALYTIWLCNFEVNDNMKKII
jgi:hypothetical protein